MVAVDGISFLGARLAAQEGAGGRNVSMTTTNGKPDTVVLIHGLWMTPRSWENWVKRYESRGYRVLTPAYPGFEVDSALDWATQKAQQPSVAAAR
jgi:pimeloyl-ACP methyl ester carboxylesterase